MYMTINHQEIIVGCCLIYCSLTCPYFLGAHVSKDTVLILPTSPKHINVNKKREHCKEHHVQVSRITIILPEKATEHNSVLQNVLLFHL